MLVEVKRRKYSHLTATRDKARTARRRARPMERESQAEAERERPADSFLYFLSAGSGTLSVAVLDTTRRMREEICENIEY